MTFATSVLKYCRGSRGRCRIVLDDDTIANTPLLEFKLVMAHELGHCVLADIPKEIVFDTLLMGVGFIFIGCSSKKLIARSGRQWRSTVWAPTYTVRGRTLKLIAFWVRMSRRTSVSLG